MNISLEGINWIAVVVCSVVGFLVGGAWYGAIFTKKWIAAYRFTEEEVAAAAKVGARNFAVYLLVGVVMAAAMSILFKNLGVATLTDGLQVAFFLWVGFVTMVHLMQHFAGNYEPAAYFIDASYQLVWFLAMGAILGAWQ